IERHQHISPALSLAPQKLSSLCFHQLNKGIIGMYICRSLFSMGCTVQKNKNHIQLGFRSLMSKGNLVQAKVTSTLAPSHSTSSWAPRTRHEKKILAVSRKIATQKLAKAVKIPRESSLPGGPPEPREQRTVCRHVCKQSNRSRLPPPRHAAHNPGTWRLPRLPKWKCALSYRKTNT
uniref:Uncharacterized protein n=1 Tax=Chelonoidis abingdonii TaxID=106734 RepID=A0A8C0GA57_CHEAB